MANTKEKRVFFDVWILETNTVYREVPYTVVADWVQQGRLLEDDKIRPSGTADWLPLGDSAAFTAYLPRADPFETDDKAEALEPVQIDFVWKRASDEGDDDVDMIPLIDVSLVLLIFFMMTATVASATSFINVPWALNAVQVLNDPKMFWIGIEKTPNGIRYSLGQAEANPQPEDRDLTEEQLLARLDQRLKEEGLADVTVKADRTLSYEVLQRLTYTLETRRKAGAIRKVFAGVNERRAQ